MTPVPTHPIDLSEGDSNISPHRRAWDARLSPDTRALLARDARVFLHQSLSSPCLNALTRARGSRLTDVTGREFLDFHGNNLHQVGFGHPRVMAAMAQQMENLPFCPRRYTNEAAVALAERLTALAPGNLDKVLFAPGGTSAVGMALKLARLATGRHKTLSMWESFHGASLDAISIGGESLFRRGMGPLMPGTEHIPPADPYHCLFDTDCTGCGLKCVRYLEYVLDKEKDIGALIAEPIRCTAVNPPPPGYWAAVRRACNRHGTLLIFDETAVCLGRTGQTFAFKHFEVVPDMVILGKGLGGGTMPLAALLVREDLDIAPDRALGHYTHEKNPVACAAALAVLDIIEDEDLLERSRTLGKAAMDRLNTMAEDLPAIGDVRGLGLLFGVELVTDRATREPATDLADRVMYHCLDQGLSFKVSRGNFLTLTPPLTITHADMDRALTIIETAIREESRTIL